MSDLEQLLTRINYVENNNIDDLVIYEEGGRKLNDKKEYISLNVHNQLITFNWDNVISFTVETTEAFNPYYVGWVEKANINNFAPGSDNTLGDDTKGGIPTVGIFSGDGSVKFLDGFIRPADDVADFFEEGDTVTCSRDGTDFNFYVNGVLVNSVPHSGWTGFYPAIDLETNIEVRITDVVYE